ncbi:MAG: hypothetical protein R6W83_11530, partial [Cryobacterium sp.]
MSQYKNPDLSVRTGKRGLDRSFVAPRPARVVEARILAGRGARYERSRPREPTSRPEFSTALRSENLSPFPHLSQVKNYLNGWDILNKQNFFGIKNIDVN